MQDPTLENLTNERIYPIVGKIISSPYDWGGTKLIPQALSFDPEPGVPYAEYWLGAYKNNPSLLTLPDGTTKTLEEMIKDNPEEILGAEVAREFGELPFLFKLLEAQKMLSVQVHPNKQQALEGFDQEEKTGMPSTDIRRTYKDKNQKTEMAVALDDFWVIHGLRPKDEMQALLTFTPEFVPLIPFFEGDYKKLYNHILVDMSDHDVNIMLDALAKRIVPRFEAGEIQKNSPDYWAAKAIKDFKMHDGAYDRGLYSIYFLNLVNLKPGQALLQEAGVLHAYLEGPIIEVMQNSDNIARAGITVKRIDVEGLMTFASFESHAPKILTGRREESGEEFFDIPLDEFVVSRIHLSSEYPYKNTSYSTEILMSLGGNATITAIGQSFPLGKGKSIVVFAGATYEIHGNENDVVYRTSVPVKNR